MDFTKFKDILSRFNKNEIEALFDFDVIDAINNWTSSDEAYSATYLIKLLISVEGYSLFKNSDFRKSFFEAMDYEDLKTILPEDKNLDHKELAKKATSFNFTENEMYRNLFNLILNSKDFEFDEVKKEKANEIIYEPQEKMFELLDYQYIIEQQTLYELKRKNKIGRKVLIHMPTGTGKTKTTMHIVTNYLNFIASDTAQVMWIADRNELLSQAAETFVNVWNHLGRKNIEINKNWGYNSNPKRARVIFVSIQTLVKMNKSELEKFIKGVRLTVFDECHKIGANKYKRVANMVSQSTEDCKRNFIGLTATPGRTTNKSTENRDFTEFFDKIIKIDCDLAEKISKPKLTAANSKKYSDEQIITYFQDRKILSKIDKEELSYDVDTKLLNDIIKEYKSKTEDYSADIIKRIAENRSRNTAIIKRLKELDSNGIPTIVFACSVNHAKLLSAFLNIENIPNSLVFGAMPSSTRKKAILDFKNKNNKTNIIINYDVLTTGFDATNIDCVFITRPTKSIILYSQMIGRGLRGPMMGGNERCKLIDVKDNLSIYDENEAFSHFKTYWR